MNDRPGVSTALSAADSPEVVFDRSADGFIVARVDDLTLAMLPRGDGAPGGFIASAWRVGRPLPELTRPNFYSHEGRVADEAEFRARVFETAEHRRELALLNRVQKQHYCSTPWGWSQMVTVYAEGVVSHVTASHGGFHLSPERNAQVHIALRSADCFYEEDCSWTAVAITFPDLFTGYERRIADQTCKTWQPDAWEVIHGVVRAPGQSDVKDRRAFERVHADDWAVISAIRSDQHPDMTEVIATLGGRRGSCVVEQRYLVPSSEYKVGQFGFVIDETRHQAYEGASSFLSWAGRAT